METTRHLRLKHAIVGLLIEQGYLAIGLEVRCPISRYRVDVAGYSDRPPPEVTDAAGTLFANHPAAACSRSAPQPRTILVECKQSRADFLRDRRDAARLLERRDALDALRERFEHGRLKRDEPHLRCNGSALFADLEQWDFSQATSPGYRRIIRKLRHIDEQLYGETKFCRIDRYRLADRLYLAAPRGMITPRELPRGWGLLECSTRWLTSDAPLPAKPSTVVRVRASAEMKGAPSRFHQRLLRNIAIAATREAFITGVAADNDEPGALSPS